MNSPRPMPPGVDAVLIDAALTDAATVHLGGVLPTEAAKAAESRWLTPAVARDLATRTDTRAALPVLARNPRTPADVVLTLAQHPSDAVRRAAQAHRLCPFSVLTADPGAEPWSHPDCPGEDAGVGVRVPGDDG